MALDFPTSPTNGQKFPASPIAGVPTYTWDSEKWTTQSDVIGNLYVAKSGDTMTGALALPGNPSTALQAAPKQYVDTFAAPFDALAYNGLQVNGSMDVSQELGSSGTGTHDAFICDGWRLGKVGTMVLAANQGSNIGYIAGLPNLLVLAATTAQTTLGAGDLAYARTRIEGYRTARLAWGSASAQPITICFWSSHARSGVYSGAVRNNNATRSYTFNYTQSTGNVPQYNTVVVSGDTTGTWEITNLTSLDVCFTMASGTTYIAPTANAWYGANYVAAPGQVNGAAATSDVFRITGVTVLPGIQTPIAARSPFIMRPYDQELVTCQRYFTKRDYFNNSNNYLAKYPGAGAIDRFQFPITMRAIPTLTITNTANWQYCNASGTWVALGSITVGPIDNQSGYFAGGAVDLDSVPRMYRQTSGATQSIFVDARL